MRKMNSVDRIRWCTKNILRACMLWLASLLQPSPSLPPPPALPAVVSNSESVGAPEERALQELEVKYSNTDAAKEPRSEGLICIFSMLPAEALKSKMYQDFFASTDEKADR